MKALITVLALVLVLNFNIAEASEQAFCKEFPGTVITAVDNLSLRNGDGDWMGWANKGASIKISGLHQGEISPEIFGKKRIWGSGELDGIAVFFAVTSESGYILNVHDPCNHLRALLADQGIIIPGLPEKSVRATNKEFLRLIVREENGVEIGKITPNQEFGVTGVKLKGNRVFGEVHSLYQGKVFVPLTNISLFRKIHVNIFPGEWEEVRRVFPETNEYLEKLKIISRQ